MGEGVSRIICSSVTSLKTSLHTISELRHLKVGRVVSKKLHNILTLPDKNHFENYSGVPEVLVSRMF